jgi:hypothetical protein
VCVRVREREIVLYVGWIGRWGIVRERERERDISREGVCGSM